MTTLKKVIAVDAMGGDFGPAVTVAASLKALKSFQGLSINLVGDVDQIKSELKKHKHAEKFSSRLHFSAATVDVDGERMSSFSSVRTQSDSPIAVGVDILKEKKADALVSAGHTAFLMARSSFVLKRTPGLSRPAICSLIPTTHGFSLLLDVGANLESNAENLYEFALMGNALAKIISQKRQPSIALLNIGTESVKGTEIIKDAADLIEHNPYLNYVGYVEGHGMFKGLADVIVCDGFAGNVALKASEGATVFVGEKIKQSSSSTFIRKMFAPLVYPFFAEIKKQLNPQTYNGAVLLGVQGIVVKSHGHADVSGFYHAIERAYFAAQGNLLESIHQSFESSVI